MALPRKYVHIGFPKSASTSLQNFYFATHPDCYHMGLGYESKGNRYIDEGVEMVSEIDVRMKKQWLYDPELSLSRLQPHFDAAAEQGKKAVGMSNEFLSFTIGNEVDPVEKAVRLRGLFGPDAVVVIIIREQFSILKSLYLEMLKGGYRGTYRKFLEYTLLYQVRSWAVDFCYDKVFETYAGLFKKKNICMLPIELLKADPAAFLSRIANAIGVEDNQTELKSVNQASETLGFYEQLRRFNERYPHEFGTYMYEPFNMNRMRAYFHNELKLAVPHDRLTDDYMRQPIQQAAAMFTSRANLPDIDLRIPKGLEEELTKLYQPSNKRLKQISGIDVNQYGYRMEK
jgi:hypothetical protein